MTLKIKLSELDRIRFGVITAQVTLDPESSVDEMLSWCRGNDVEMIIARCDARHIQVVQLAEHEGFYLTDTLVYFSNSELAESAVRLPEGFAWRMAKREDADAIEVVAAESFRNYVGHYHSDPHLNKSDADLVYSSWARRSCEGLAEGIIVIQYEKAIVAFLTIVLRDKDVCEIALNGVLPQFQGRGLYTALIALAKNWAVTNSMRQMLVSTQLINLAVQKVWCRHGFEPHGSFYTFHKWLLK